ncbi:MAG: transposase [Bacteroidales bacterium]|nr:transposase [Bacteroidales bacterium]
MGLVLAVFIHAANIHDSKAGIDIIAMLRERFSRLKKIVADGGYRGELIEKVKDRFSWVLEIVLRSDKKQNCTLLPQRWVVERTFAWFESYRRLSKDYEYNTDTSEAMIQLAMVRLMLNRIIK